ncbi:MAG: hypothetical protein ACI4OL_04310 [Gemmiger sp.]
MSDVCFRLARPGEDGRIAEFINANFDMRLPLIHRPEFYEHYYKALGNMPQFALAEQDGELLSAAGYIAAAQGPHPDVWVSVWVAKKGHNGIGLELMNSLPGLLGAEVVACNNIRPKTCKLYEFLGWTAGRIPHYYRLAPRPAYRLAVPAPGSTRLPVTGDLILTRLPDAQALQALGMPSTPHTPRKDCWYLRRRYFEYPHYHYDVWAALPPGQPLRGGARLLAYVVTRLTPAGSGGPEVPVLRLVDFIGPDEALPRLGAALDGLLRDTGAEYMDCYCAGISAETWAAAGFTERREGDGAVIPNYLNPPLAANTEYYYFTNSPENFVLFKADGDQDRPNLQ